MQEDNKQSPIPPRSYSSAVSGSSKPDTPSLSGDTSAADSESLSSLSSPSSSADSLQTAIDEPLELPPLVKGIAAYPPFRLASPTPASVREQRAARKLQHVHAPRRSSGAFNPQAAPFVPAHLPASPSPPQSSKPAPLSAPVLHTAVPSSSSLPVPRSPVPQPPRAVEPYRPWTYQFNKGLDAASDEQRAFHANGVVAIRDWTGPRLQDLAWCLTWQATEARTRRNAAPFVEALGKSFRECYGEDLATAFEWHVRDYALQTFCGWWDPNNALCTTHDAGAPREDVDCALALARYIGQLFSVALLTAPHVHLCLNVLVTNTAFVEHVHAVRDVLAHAGARLCEGEAQRASMKELLATLEPKSKALGNNASLKGARFDQAQVHIWFTEISRMVNGWLSPPETQASV